MNREIKFRAWEKHAKRMSKVTLIEWKPSYLYHRICTQAIVKGKKIDEQYAYEFGSDSNGIVLLQYTGLKDVNGKEIYEGDIVKARDAVVDGSQRYYICEITWMQSGWYAMKYKDKMGKEHYLNVNILQTEIIGNIYDNPELLEVANE